MIELKNGSMGIRSQYNLSN